MFRSQLRLASFLCTVLSLVICTTNAQAGIEVIISAAPPVREVIVIPPGYSNCYTVAPGFYNGIWHYKHRICEYDNNSGPGLWIAGYWQCVDFMDGGRCTRTAWIGSHWANTSDWEYRQYRGHGNYYHEGHGSNFYRGPGNAYHRNHGNEFHEAHPNGYHRGDHGGNQYQGGGHRPEHGFEQNNQHGHGH